MDPGESDDPGSSSSVRPGRCHRRRWRPAGPERKRASRRGPGDQLARPIQADPPPLRARGFGSGPGRCSAARNEPQPLRPGYCQPGIEVVPLQAQLNCAGRDLDRSAIPKTSPWGHGDDPVVENSGRCQTQDAAPPGGNLLSTPSQDSVGADSGEVVVEGRRSLSDRARKGPELRPARKAVSEAFEGSSPGRGRVQVRQRSRSRLGPGRAS